jgi:tetratricopeptide (TPR) repeat protein
MLAASLALGLGPALADMDSMNQGMAEYKSGNYSDALGHLQGALSTDFQNAKLHYYLANTYVHLNQKEAAIKEFRIAYALEPDKEVGRLSKQALGYMGVDGESKAKEKETGQSESKPSNDPILDKITASLQQQAKSLNSSAGLSASDIARRNSDQLARTKTDMLQDISYYRRGRLIQLPLPDEALKQLDNLKQMYDAQKNGRQDDGARRSDEVQRSADNLTGLLNDKGKSGSPKLVPEGTNLYIRNYKNEQATTSASPPAATPPKSSASPK